jgi:pyrimidine-specific ribonucleoside hydrolase
VIPVIADVDTGLDDALALAYLTATPHADLRAVTCVAGNTHVEQVVANTLTVLDGVGAPPVPVATGARRPLVSPPRHAHGFHGSDGLGDLALAPSGRRPVPAAAVDLIRTTIERSAEPVTLLALGPLTNVALFLRTFPDHAARLARIVFMGGALAIGNATPVAEFNAWHDPEALHVLLHSGIPVTMYGLEVFERPRLARSAVAAWASSAHPPHRFVGSLLTAYGRHDPPAAPVGIGDAGAACYLARPEHGTVERLPTTVQLAGTGRGQTIVDRRARSGESEQHAGPGQAPPTDVVTEIDADAVAADFTTAINALAHEPAGRA